MLPLNPSPNTLGEFTVDEIDDFPAGFKNGLKLSKCMRFQVEIDFNFDQLPISNQFRLGQTLKKKVFVTVHCTQWQHVNMLAHCV